MDSRGKLVKLLGVGLSRTYLAEQLEVTTRELDMYTNGTREVPFAVNIKLTELYENQDRIPATALRDFKIHLGSKIGAARRSQYAKIQRQMRLQRIETTKTLLEQSQTAIQTLLVEMGREEPKVNQAMLTLLQFVERTKRKAR